MATLLQEVIEQFGLPEKPKSHTLAKETVVAWMRSSDIEVLGALYAFLMKPDYAKRIVPALAFSDYAGFLTHYFERCFKENPDGDWSHSRYEAAWDFASWFGTVWKNRQIDRDEVAKLKDWLAKTYKSADEPTRRCLVDGTLEHLFESREIARFFTDWKKDTELSTAYAEAAEWSAKAGRTGLMQPHKAKGNRAN